MSIILSGQEKDKLCNELNIKYDAPRLLLKIDNKKASYYNIKENSYKNINLEIANKYI